MKSRISTIYNKVYQLFNLRKIKDTYQNQESFKKIISNLGQKNKKILYFHHEWGGGADFYLQNKIEQLKSKNYVFVIIYKSKLDKLNLQITFKEEFASVLFNDFKELSNLLDKIKIDQIYINQLSFFPNIDVAFAFIKQSKNLGTKTTMLIHDFSIICTNTHLIKDDGSVCDMICGKNKCICSPAAQENIKKWQSFLISQIDEILCFSEYSKQIVGQFYPAISDKINIVPHFVPFLRKVNIVKNNLTINIAVIGFLNKIKGCDIVEEMSKLIISKNLPAKIFVIGKCKKKANLALEILGKFDRKDLPPILEKNQIDIVFISSICPETFSYVSHEAMLMGAKVACFDIGAQSEYIKKYDKGLIISQINAKTALDEILNFAKQSTR